MRLDPLPPHRIMADRGQPSFKRKYWLFALPAVIVIAAVIVFPWIFTLFMSVHEWDVKGQFTFNGIDNFRTLFTDTRFLQSVVTTLVFTLAAVILPIIVGIAAALAFHERFPLRGLLRGIFILPMMATPVAISLVWTMMFHPQLGVLNFLLVSVGLPPSQWVYATSTVIPTLVMVEVWHWTPLVMLIVLGGLAQLPREPYEAALIDGAGYWQQFWYITVPLILPFIMIALIIRTIDALKTFDTIFVITGGGPGTASETINIFLYQQAFAFIKLGYASTVALIFFVLIILLSLLLLYVRQRMKWTS
jgi:multiple sugar transport system permease protein